MRLIEVEGGVRVGVEVEVGVDVEVKLESGGEGSKSQLHLDML